MQRAGRRSGKRVKEEGEDFQAEDYGKKLFNGQLGAAISTWKGSKLGWTNGCSTFSFFSDKGRWGRAGHAFSFISSFDLPQQAGF